MFEDNNTYTVKVLLEKGVWLLGWPAVCEGDPPRTLREDSAYLFSNIDQARQALKEARSYRPFKDAVLCWVWNGI